jgi:precorrin-6B methylase 2
MFDLKKINVFEMINAAYAANVIFVVLEAGIFEDIARSKKTALELSIDKGLDLLTLIALMDACVALELIQSHDGKYQLAKKGRYFLKISNSWFRDYLLVWGRHLNPAMSNVKNSLKNGGNAFELAHGEKIWDFYANNNVENNIFVDFMNGVTSQGHLNIITNEIDLHSFKTILDVGGGTGSLGCALANKYPEISVTVFDQESNFNKATEKIKQLNINSNCSFKGGSIFKNIPSNFDLYTIKHVLHDWDDENVELILIQIFDSMRVDSRLMIIEGVLDRKFHHEKNESEYLHLRNIEQMSWTPGKVRSLDEFKALLNRVGLSIEKVNDSEIFDISYILCRKSLR